MRRLNRINKHHKVGSRGPHTTARLPTNTHHPHHLQIYPKQPLHGNELSPSLYPHHQQHHPSSAVAVPYPKPTSPLSPSRADLSAPISTPTQPHPAPPKSKQICLRTAPPTPSPPPQPQSAAPPQPVLQRRFPSRLPPSPQPTTSPSSNPPWKTSGSGAVTCIVY